VRATLAKSKKRRRQSGRFERKESTCGTVHLGRELGLTRFEAGPAVYIIRMKPRGSVSAGIGDEMKGVGEKFWRKGR